MAKNRYRHEGRKLHLNVSAINGTGVGNLCKSGDPGVIGRLPVVCLTDEDANGEATVDTKGVWLLDVVNATVGALDPGASVYWDNAAGTLGGDNADAFFGTIVGRTSVPAGQTVQVEVRIGY